MTDWHRLGLIAAVFLLAGLVKGVIGLGLPTVAVGLLSLAMPPAQAAALLVLPALVTNVWQMAGRGLGLHARRLAGLLLGIGVGTLAGSGLIVGSMAHWAGLGLGLALLAYAVVGLARVRLVVAAGAEWWAGPLTGVLTGLVSGATGVFVLPLVPYLAALRLERDALVQAMGLAFTVATLSLAAGLALHGALPVRTLGTSVVAVAPALLGMAVGGLLRVRVRPAVFRVCFFAGLLVLGAELTWHALR